FISVRSDRTAARKRYTGKIRSTTRFTKVLDENKSDAYPAPRENAMRVAVIGAGPAGLFFALLLKRKQPHHDVMMVEQNRRDATFGFGVVFSGGALEFLSRDAPEMYAALIPLMESWPIQRIVHRGVAVDVDGNGFSAVGRMRLLQILQKHAED